ncbi:VirB4-like conjugal transfer ATPase, CD1110 family, partial [Lactococcus lactis]
RNLSDELFKDLTEAEVEMAITIHGTPYSISDTNQRLRNEVTDVEIEVIKREMKASSRGYNTQHIARTTKE